MKVATSIRNDELPKKLAYVVMVFEDQDVPMSLGMTRLVYQGFLSEQSQMSISTFYAGDEKHSDGIIVQLPKVFHSKNEAEQRINMHAKMNSCFGVKPHYKIIPIDIG